MKKYVILNFIWMLTFCTQEEKKEYVFLEPQKGDLVVEEVIPSLVIPVVLETWKYPYGSRAYVFSIKENMQKVQKGEKVIELKDPILEENIKDLKEDIEELKTKKESLIFDFENEKLSNEIEMAKKEMNIFLAENELEKALNLSKVDKEIKQKELHFTKEEKEIFIKNKKVKEERFLKDLKKYDENLEIELKKLVKKEEEYQKLLIFSKEEGVFVNHSSTYYNFKEEQVLASLIQEKKATIGAILRNNDIFLAKEALYFYVKHPQSGKKYPLTLKGMSEGFKKILWEFESEWGFKEARFLENFEDFYPFIGMDLPLYAVMQEKKEVLKIPLIATLEENKICVLENNQPQKKQVQLGVKSRLEVELLSSLDPSWKLIESRECHSLEKHEISCRVRNFMLFLGRMSFYSSQEGYG